MCVVPESGGVFVEILFIMESHRLVVVTRFNLLRQFVWLGLLT